MADRYKVPVGVRFFRWWCRPVFRLIFRLLGPVKITGWENVPKSGAYLITMNHVSLFDPPFLLAFWPVAPDAVGAADVWKRKGQATLVSWYGGIPIHRGEYERQVLDALVHVLRSGRPLLIAPEGARSHTPGMKQAHPGVAYLVEKTNVPVVPVGIVGTTDDYFNRGIHGKRPLIEMHIGKPFYLPPLEQLGGTRREARQRGADLIMQHIAAQLPPLYRGVYGQPAVDSA